MLRVWDLPTRLFHWLLAATVAAAAATGFLAPEWWLGIHVWAGYGVAGLIVFRAVWGVYGSQHSRFSDFAYSPRAVLAHLRDLLSGRLADFVGHNPAGAAMIFALGLVLAGIVASGLVALGGAEKQGVLAGLVSFRTGHAAREVHEVLVLLLLGLVALHVGGVLLESARGSSNLVLAMITGRKPRLAGAVPPSPRPARPLAAATALALLALAGAAAGSALGALPPLGVRDLQVDA
ncbi:MAG TPA: cytochrome B, partial [Alphaproteobacteria bacterium]|nr:cytochrome B [Alphaproteobacteria bacterium]